MHAHRVGLAIDPDEAIARPANNGKENGRGARPNCGIRRPQQIMPACPPAQQFCALQSDPRLRITRFQGDDALSRRHSESASHLPRF